MVNSRYRLNVSCPDTSIEDHRKMEELCLEVHNQCLKSKKYRWAVITLFYYALHKTNRLVKEIDPNCYLDNHSKIKIEIDNKLISKYPDYFNHYKNLEYKSREARYCPDLSLNWNKKPNKQMIESFIKTTKNFFTITVK